MGLDQYVTNGQGDELQYYCKFGELHNLLEAVYKKQGGIDEFNCIDLQLTEEICDEVIESIQTRNMPDCDGFFFGSSNMEDEEYLEEALTHFKGFKEQIKEGETVIYSAWY